MKKMTKVFLFGMLALLVAGCAEGDIITGDITQANEMAADLTLKSIATSMPMQKATKGKYPLTLAEVGQVINQPEFSACTAPGILSKPINNYLYEMVPDKEWNGSSFFIRCRPENPNFGKKYFMLDSSGTVRTVAPFGPTPTPSSNQ